MSDEKRERRIAFTGAFNFRDLGGYQAAGGRTVRWRRLFRSDALHYMTAEDAELARGKLAIATIVDLRAHNEQQHGRSGVLADGVVAYHHLPLMDEMDYSFEAGAARDAAGTAERYLRILEGSGQQVAGLVRLLASDVYPAVVHCAAGKDRTGIAAAVVLSLLDVDQEDIARDYGLSSLYLGPIVERMRHMPGYRKIVGKLPLESFNTHPETMVLFLERVRRGYGSVQGFLQGHAVDAATILRLRDHLLEGDPVE